MYMTEPDLGRRGPGTHASQFHQTVSILLVANDIQMPTRLRLSYSALLIIVLVRPNYKLGPRPARLVGGLDLRLVRASLFNLC